MQTDIIFYFLKKWTEWSKIRRLGDNKPIWEDLKSKIYNPTGSSNSQKLWRNLKKSLWDEAQNIIVTQERLAQAVDMESDVWAIHLSDYSPEAHHLIPSSFNGKNATKKTKRTNWTTRWSFL